MWDTVSEMQTSRIHLSRELPCLSCGHAAHTYVDCDSECDCRATAMPGAAVYR